MQATSGPAPLFFDPNALSRFPGNPPFDQNGLLALLITSGRQLEAEGRMDEALERYFAALKFTADLAATSHILQNYSGRSASYADVFRQITVWAAQKEQTPKSIRAALERVKSFDLNQFRVEEPLKSLYIVAEQMLNGNADARQAFFSTPFPRGGLGIYLLWSTLM